MIRGRFAAAAAAVAVVAVLGACTGDGIRIEVGSPTPPTPSPGPRSGGSSDDPGRTGLTADPVRTGEEHALAAMRELCIAPRPVSTDDDGAPAQTPADVAEVESQVEQVRGLEFLRPVVVQPVSADEIAGKLRDAFDETYPKAFYDRRSVAWQTIGVLPGTVTNVITGCP